MQIDHGSAGGLTRRQVLLAAAAFSILKLRTHKPSALRSRKWRLPR